MARFIVETTLRVWSPKNWKFRVETIIKFKVKTTIEVYSPKDWKFKVETTERELKKKFFLIVWFVCKKTSENWKKNKWQQKLEKKE